MPLKNGKLTKQEHVFIDAMVQSGDKPYAAHRAGYKHPDVNGYLIAKRPAVDQEIRERAMARLFNEGVPLAIGTLIDIAGNGKAPWNSRVAASKEILAAADRERGAGATAKEPHEMTNDEIAARLAQLEAQEIALTTIAADRARPVEQMPAIDDEESVPTGAFELDMFD